MKRVSILLVLLMAFVAACGGGEASPSATDTDTEPDPTAEATDSPEPTDEASVEPGSSGGTAFEGDLDDVIPDELNGVARTDIQGMDTLFAGLLGGQGLDTSQAQFAFATYGEGDDAVILNAFAVPGMNDGTLNFLARAMAGVGTGTGEVDIEDVTIDGKEVLRLSGGDVQSGSVFIYFADGAVFSVISENEDLAEDLLGELP